MSVNLINEFIEKRMAGMDYSEIRDELMSLGYTKDDVRDIINEIDEKYLKILEQKNNKSISNILNGSVRFILGIGLLLICFLYISVIFYTGESPGFIVICIISISFSAGSWFFITGKKALLLASERKIPLKQEKDILD